MTWTRLSDDFMDRPEILLLSRSARLLHIEAMVWCNRQLTDGLLPVNALRRATDSEAIDDDVAELMNATLWTRVDDRHWQVDWSDQESADTVRKRRSDHAKRQKAYEERRELHAAGIHTKCRPDHCKLAGRTSSDASGDALPTQPNPTRPVPSRPEGEGQGQGRDSSASSGGSASLAASSAPPPDHAAVMIPVLAGPPLGVIPTINGVPAWAAHRDQGRTV